MGLPDSIADRFIDTVGEGNVLRFLLNKNLPASMFDLFCFLDQGITIDAVIEALGYEVCIALAKQGLLRVGYIAALPRGSLTSQYGVSEVEADVVERFLGLSGLQFGANTSAWLHYRMMVPQSFRLFRTEARSLSELAKPRSSTRNVA